MVEKLNLLGRRLRLSVDGKDLECLASYYIQAKTKQLREFGYTDLSEKNVMQQLLALLNKEELTVIGMFMEGEVLGFAGEKRNES